MSLVPWRKRNELTPWRTFRDMDDMFDHVFGNCALAPSEWAPAVDISESEDGYTIKADLPGMKKEDIEVSAYDDTVVIKGERKSEHEDKEKGYHRVERQYGSFSRTFRVPGGLDAKKVTADYKDGVLHVTVPKCEEAKPKLIEVKVK